MIKEVEGKIPLFYRRYRKMSVKKVYIINSTHNL